MTKSPRRRTTISSLKRGALTAIFLTGSLVSASAQKALPEAIAAPGETAVLKLHAEGAQVYECKNGTDGTLAWTFREPVATLILDGKTVGRHYAGPTWEHIDGSTVVARPVANAPGKTAADIPWLKLEITFGRGMGLLTSTMTVQRVNTSGGVHSGPCEKAGVFYSAPYSTDYVFLRKGM